MKLKKQAATLTDGQRFALAAAHLAETHPQISSLKKSEKVDFADALIKKLSTGVARLKREYGTGKKPSASQEFQGETANMIFARLARKAKVEKPEEISKHLLEIFHALKKGSED